MGKYKRLGMEEREEISRMLASRKTLRTIAKKLGRSVSTISREIRAGSCNKYTYRAKRAQDRSSRNMRKRNAGNYLLDKHARLKAYVFEHLRQGHQYRLQNSSKNSILRTTVCEYHTRPFTAICMYSHEGH